MLEKEEFGIIRTESREEEADTRDEEGFLSSQPRSHDSRNAASYDTTDKCTGCCEPVPEIGVQEALGPHEEGLETLLRSGYDSCIISEQEPSNNGNKNYRKQIALAAFVSVRGSHRLYLQ